jgi:hypothetical protein
MDHGRIGDLERTPSGAKPLTKKGTSYRCKSARLSRLKVRREASYVRFRLRHCSNDHNSHYIAIQCDNLVDL